jgi:hypothetical protein
LIRDINPSNHVHSLRCKNASKNNTLKPVVTHGIFSISKTHYLQLYHRDTTASSSLASAIDSYRVSSRDEMSVWRDILEWALLAEGGHNTAPHTDSHGLATWITVQEGSFGFGWMSDPSQQEKWMGSPDSYVDAPWKYIVLSPGQTIFFPSGTIHFVFRRRDQQTLALGGHILQGIERWAEVVIHQLIRPRITNEDMKDAPQYAKVIAQLIKARIKYGRNDTSDSESANQIINILEVR